MGAAKLVGANLLLSANFGECGLFDQREGWPMAKMAPALGIEPRT